MAGFEFRCLVAPAGDATSFTALGADGRMVFPGMVRWERGGSMMWELRSIQDE